MRKLFVRPADRVGSVASTSTPNAQSRGGYNRHQHQHRNNIGKRNANIDYQQPRLIATFSKDEDGKTLVPGTIRSFRFPRFPSDLNHGYPDSYIEKRFAGDGSEDSGLEPVITTIRQQHIDLKARGTNFVSYRNNLNKIMATPYNNREEWEIEVFRYDDVIFLHVVDTSNSNNNERSNRPPSSSKATTTTSTTLSIPASSSTHPYVVSNGGGDDFGKRATYWGYKFESLCTVGGGGSGDSSNATIVNPNIEFGGLFETRLNNNRLLLSAEIDCIDDMNAIPTVLERTGGGGARRAPPRSHNNASDDLPDASKFVELKTNRALTEPRFIKTFERFKLLKIWIQSYLVGVPNVVIGFRDDDGVLLSAKVFQTLNLPSMAKQYWNPWTCLEFTNRCLDFLRDNTENDRFYTFKYTHPFSYVTLSEPLAPLSLSEEQQKRKAMFLSALATTTTTTTGMK